MSMKVLRRDLRKGFAKLKIENLDDLWYLSHIIDIGDRIKGSTFRKIKIGDSDKERNVSIIKKKIFLKIIVEKIEFHKYSDILRVSGKISEGPEDVSIGTYHTFNLEPSTEFTLEKDEFLGYQIDKLKESEKPRTTEILMLVFDRESALFAIMKNYGYEVLSELQGNIQKKDSPEIIKNNTFYKEIMQQIKGYDEKYNASKIIIGSPAFWKEYLLKEIDDENIKPKIITASINSVGKNGLNELLKRPEVTSALSNDRIVEETSKVEKLLAEIKKDSNAAYGLKESEKAVNMGAVKELLVTDGLIKEMRQKETYGRLDKIMKDANSMKAKISIISSEHDSGKKLDGLGGIGAILRYRIN